MIKYGDYFIYFSESNKIFIIFAIIFTIVLLRVPTMWAMELTTIEDCDLFESKFLSPTEFSQNEVFKAFDIIVNVFFFSFFKIFLLRNYFIE